MFNNIPGWLKIILASIGSILIGGIGSGVWEKVLSPLFNLISNTITTILSALSSTYSDSLYKNASNLFYNTNLPVLLIVYIMTFILFLYALNSKKENEFVEGVYVGLTIMTKGWIGIVFTASLFIMSVVGMSRFDTIDSIRIYSQKQMEIVRPYIGEQQYLQLRSDYLQIQNKKDFEHFLQDMYKASDIAHIEIEKFE